MHIIYYIFPIPVVGCFINNQLTKNTRNMQIKLSLGTELLLHYLCTKNGWTTEEFHTINWNAHQTALNKVKRTHRATLIKYIHGWLATNFRNCQIGRSKDDRYPLCGLQDTKFHYLYCKDPELDMKRKKLWGEAEKSSTDTLIRK